MRIFLTILLLFSWPAGQALAKSGPHPFAGMPGLEQPVMLAQRGPPPRHGMLPGGPMMRFNNREAAGRVKQQFPGHKILSVDLVDRNGPPKYRVKTLSNSGVVKFVFVDAINGEVYE